MSTNKRIFYACQGVTIANVGTYSGDYGTGNMVHGVQAIGTTTTFNPEQAFELGQVEIYENVEGTPDVEVTMSKVIDGYPLIYHMASTGVVGGSASNSGLVNRSNQQCDLTLGIFPEENLNIAGASATAEVEVYLSGLFISSLGYTFPVDGFCEESVTLVGNNKQWITTGGKRISVAMANDFDGLDAPLAVGVLGAASGGIQRREDVILESCIFPASIKGVAGTGIGNAKSGTLNLIHVQNVSINTDFSREDILELGKKTPYYRPAGFPIEVTCEIEAITTSGDFVFAYEEGDPALYGTTASGDNTGEENIYIQLRGGHAWDLGSRNRLTSVTYGGGDATGGNVSTTYSYTNFNDLDVQWSGDYIGFNSI
jgi:hypothetical protein